mmetsp:Transcript_21500/g.32635  ORF Transcript_21500/g.32635 Transcript_21500/m.32635 type:complete len:222 (+) Transcript_21500:108-773(+)
MKTTNPSSNWIAPTMEHPLDVGIVSDGINSNKCCHRLRLEPLTRYLDGTDPINGSTCPVCQAPVTLVTDGLAAGVTDGIVFFKYSKHMYRLTVRDDRFFFLRYLSFRSLHLAQDRISRLLNIKDLRILCKGKIIYPDSKKTEEELSKLLLDFSASSIQSNKASLVVMGTRVGKELRNHEGIGVVLFMCLSMGKSMLYSALNWMYQFVISIFQPALPPSHED